MFGFFFFQCAKNCFVLNKAKRYIRLKIQVTTARKQGEEVPPSCHAPATHFSRRPRPGHSNKAETGRSGGIHSCGPGPCRLTHSDSRRKKPRNRIHWVYSRVSGPLPRQLPDSRKRSFLSHKGRSEGGGEEGTDAQGTLAPMSERWVQAHTQPTRGPSRATAPGLGRLRQPGPSRLPWPPKVTQGQKEDL